MFGYHKFEYNLIFKSQQMRECAEKTLGTKPLPAIPGLIYGPIPKDPCVVLELPDVQNKIAIFNFRRAQNSIFTRCIYLSIFLVAQLHCIGFVRLYV